MYERDIRKQVEADHHGKVIAIDVDTGNWAVGDNVIAATDRLRERYPDTINVLSERVGYPALRHFGGRPIRRAGVIEGVVNATYEAVISVTVAGPSGPTREIEAVVDTGYNGFLTLPPALVAELGLPFASIGRASLADGSEVTFLSMASPCFGTVTSKASRSTRQILAPWWVCCCLTATS